MADLRIRNTMAQPETMTNSGINRAEADIPLNVDVAVDGDGWKSVGDAEAISLSAARAAFAAAVSVGFDGVPVGGRGEISICLSDDAEVQALNRAWRDQDKPTNVLSFSALEGDAAPAVPGAEVLLGDVIVAFETTRTEADKEGKSTADHLAHLVVHGVLHLVGFDHTSDADAAEMEGLEVRVLAGLGIQNPYAEISHDR